MKCANLYSNIPSQLPDELIETLASGDGVRIERIVSKGHCSEPGFWYDQEEDEWVIVLRGEARLRFEDDRAVHLSEGDWVHIPAHERHRVEWTKEDADTIWLAVFYRS